ncbi:hypothetical protein OH786_34045 [Streptomyces atratus]|uniref:Uncharacterized protein n=1 Tax=Streptomyces atratus TaxID=1893 RepID=A0A1K2EA58_STRAR|nr:hypothetical protein [Streptomyces atratus]SFY32481.1 hypothetical protein SAMN02787144_101824 [Streptomyces atratus]
MKLGRVSAVAAIAAATLIGSAASPAMAATWTRTADYQRWTGLNALERGQGVATDGTYFYYAGPGGMVKATVANDSEVASSVAPIPWELSGTYGSDHIGDVEYYGGYVIAPIEDGDSGYQHPLLALYNASDLSYTGRYVQLPLAQMPGGVPWVAVDAAAGLVYTSPWDQDAAQGTNKLVAYSLNDLLNLPAGSTLPVVRTVTLSQPLSRIQGAAMWQGKLYASVDDSAKSVHSIDINSGQVAYKFHQDVESGDEVQGIAAWDFGPSGGQLHIVNVGSGWKSIFLYLQHYTQTG